MILGAVGKTSYLPPCGCGSLIDDGGPAHGALPRKPSSGEEGQDKEESLKPPSTRDFRVDGYDYIPFISSRLATKIDSSPDSRFCGLSDTFMKTSDSVQPRTCECRLM